MGKRKKSGQKRKPQPSELVKLIRTPTGSTFDCPRCSGKDTLEIKIKSSRSDAKKGKNGREVFSLTSRTTITATIVCKNCGESQKITRLQKTDAPIDVYYKYMDKLEKEKKKRMEEAAEEDDYDDYDGYDEDKLEEDYDEEEPAEAPRKKVSKKSVRDDDDDEDDEEGVKEDEDDDGEDLFGDNE